MVSARVLLVCSVLVSSCAGTSNGPDAPAEKMSPLGPVKPTEGGKSRPAGKVEFASCKDHLDAIANCFFEVVTQIGREPEQGEPIARFLGEATWQIAASHVHEACSPLGLNAESRRILLRDRSEVSVVKREDSHDDLAGGVSVWHITYTFSSPTCPHTAEANLQLHMGGPID